MTEERREFQRLNLTKPVDGWFGDFSVMLVEVSANGAKIIHDDELPVGARALLRFTWRGEDLELLAEIVRTEGARSGVRLIDESEQLHRLIETSATELLRAQQANAMGDRARNVIGDATLTSASAGVRAGRGFLQYRFSAGVWKCHRALLPDQPEDGFTVSANETQEQIDLLCVTYEGGNTDAKRMTRLIAELSVKR
jgi:PilZ domain-containing protein